MAYFRDQSVLSDTTPDAKSTVLVIDDDPDLRASVGRLLESVGLGAQLFGSISDFLESGPGAPQSLAFEDAAASPFR